MSAISEMRLLKAKLLSVNCLHRSSEVTSSVWFVSSRSVVELARAFWEYLMLSSLNFAHVSGTETLESKTKKERDQSATASLLIPTG